MEERRVWQKHIFVSARKAGITDSGILHELVSGICGKNSLKDITWQDYRQIIRELQKRSSGYSADKKPKQKPKPPQVRTVGGMSEGQIRKVWRLMYQLRGFDKQENTAPIGERLCGIIKRELKIDARSKEPFVWLTYQNGGTLIERLKKYVENAEKRNLRGD